MTPGTRPPVCPAAAQPCAAACSRHCAVKEQSVNEHMANSLHVEYSGGRMEYGILFIVSLFHEYTNLEYVHILVIYRVKRAGYVIRFLVAASQENVNTYSTCRANRQHHTTNRPTTSGECQYVADCSRYRAVNETTGCECARHR